MTPEEFVDTIFVLLKLDFEIVQTILQEDPKIWMKKAQYHLDIKESGRPKILQDEKSFELLVQKYKIGTLYEAVQESSFDLEEEAFGFHFNPF